jgi:hypothetical protein
MNELPRTFALKPNHLSGAALLVGDFVANGNPQEMFSRSFLNKYYVHPDNLNDNDVHQLVKFWFKKNFFGYHRSAFPEWAYKHVAPVVYAEELLIANDQPPHDYRFFIFNGKCQVVMIDTPGFVGVKRDIYSTEWKRISVQFGHPNSEIESEKPEVLMEMINIAEYLAYGTDHLRVDLYNLDGRIIFSELTNYHAGGTQKFDPPSFDYELGKDWHPDTQY